MSPAAPLPGGLQTKSGPSGSGHRPAPRARARGAAEAQVAQPGGRRTPPPRVDAGGREGASRGEKRLSLRSRPRRAAKRQCRRKAPCRALVVQGAGGTEPAAWRGPAHGHRQRRWAPVGHGVPGRAGGRADGLTGEAARGRPRVRPGPVLPGCGPPPSGRAPSGAARSRNSRSPVLPPGLRFVPRRCEIAPGSRGRAGGPSV